MTKNSERMMNKELHEFMEDDGGSLFGCVYLKNGEQRDAFFNHFKDRYPNTLADPIRRNIHFKDFGKAIKFCSEGEGKQPGYTTINIRTH